MRSATVILAVLAMALVCFIPGSTDATPYSEEDLIGNLCRKMEEAYETMDFEAMRGMATGEALEDIGYLKRLSKATRTLGLKLEFSEPRIDGDKASLEWRQVQVLREGEEWLFPPSDSVGTHLLRKKGEEWKFEKLW